MKKIIFIFLLLIPISILLIPKVETKKIVISQKEYNNIPHKNTDIIGSIKIPNTNINSYLVQTNNNEFYLNHNTNKELSKEGSIFIDYRNSLSDKKLIIYGHNSKDGFAPLKDLEKYKNESFYKTNQTIELNLNNTKYIYQIFSIIISPKNNYKHTVIIFNNDEYQTHLKYLKENSIYNTNIDINEKDNIIIIQTCNYEPENTFLLICAKRS